MPKLRYIYKAKITFSERIRSHSYLLRLLPFGNEAQRIVESHYHIFPRGVINKSEDVFGNKILTGYIDEFHNTFEFSSQGVLETYPYIIHEELNPIYRFVSRFTKPSDKLLQVNQELDFTRDLDNHEKAKFISDKINSLITYEGGVTGIGTSAEEALSLGKGVCQDYAHIMISLCRLNDIPARYVAGFIEGEGFSHAWVEYYEDGAWHGYDPTHNVKIAINYIKIAQGRDYGDCAIDKGVFRGVAFQNLEVIVKVEHR
ncbi:MAG: transglutaminase protein [Bacteroidetes bacterium]|jgi:transglutaminase-like putative cysteine protease|nr:transglutaminase protein [Bacteroidota bacterium]